MTEAEEYKQIKAMVDELMEGGLLGDGIGPYHTGLRVNQKFGTNYTGEEIHSIWQKGKPWYDGKSVYDLQTE